MNSFIQQAIITTFLKNKKKEEAERSAEKFLINTKRHVKDFLFIIAGITSAAFGLRGFLLPNNFIDGGATGISLLISEISGIDISILIEAINIPFILLGIHVINKTFAIKTAIAITVLAIVVHFIPFPHITSDKLLISIFGGFFLGAGIGLAIRGGSVIDGTEVLAIYLSRKFGLSIGDVIMAVNVVIFSVAAYYLSIETAMYAMLTYLSASKTVDFLVEGIEEYFGVTIISDYSDEIQSMIKDTMKRGFTVYVQKKGTGKKGERHLDAEIIYTVITRLEMGKLQAEIEKIDTDAFVVTQSVKDIKGGMVKKRPLDEH